MFLGHPKAPQEIEYNCLKQLDARARYAILKDRKRNDAHLPKAVRRASQLKDTCVSSKRRRERKHGYSLRQAQTGSTTLRVP